MILWIASLQKRARACATALLNILDVALHFITSGVAFLFFARTLWMEQEWYGALKRGVIHLVTAANDDTTAIPVANDMQRKLRLHKSWDTFVWSRCWPSNGFISSLSSFGPLQLRSLVSEHLTLLLLQNAFYACILFCICERHMQHNGFESWPLYCFLLAIRTFGLLIASCPFSRHVPSSATWSFT